MAQLKDTIIDGDLVVRGNAIFEAPQETRQNLNFLGLNPTENDAPTEWAALGNGIAYINPFAIEEDDSGSIPGGDENEGGSDGGGSGDLSDSEGANGSIELETPGTIYFIPIELQAGFIENKYDGNNTVHQTFYSTNSKIGSNMWIRIGLLDSDTWTEWTSVMSKNNTCQILWEGSAAVDSEISFDGNLYNVFLVKFVATSGGYHATHAICSKSVNSTGDIFYIRGSGGYVASDDNLCFYTVNLESTDQATWSIKKARRSLIKASSTSTTIYSLAQVIGVL